MKVFLFQKKPQDKKHEGKDKEIFIKNMSILGEIYSGTKTEHFFFGTKILKNRC